MTSPKPLLVTPGRTRKLQAACVTRRHAPQKHGEPVRRNSTQNQGIFNNVASNT